jgi:hypothetical protein
MSEKKQILLVSVVRDFSLYGRLVSNNPNCEGCEFVSFDNRDSNLSITTRYNSFLSSYDYSKDGWFVFLHEDFEFLQPLHICLETLDKNNIYGAIGIKKAEYGLLIGCNLNSTKDGARLRFLGIPIKKPTKVLTTDCDCMVVHSSLVKRCNLRFDERLSFDFYTEDFQMTAMEKFGVETFVFPLKAWHYSYGSYGMRFFKQRRYLREKYKNASRVYRTTTNQLFGPLPEIVRIIYKSRIRNRFKLLKRIRKFFWYSKYSGDGIRRFRILRVPFKIPYAKMSDWHRSIEI